MNAWNYPSNSEMVGRPLTILRPNKADAKSATGWMQMNKSFTLTENGFEMEAQFSKAVYSTEFYSSES